MEKNTQIPKTNKQKTNLWSSKVRDNRVYQLTTFNWHHSYSMKYDMQI